MSRKVWTAIVAVACCIGILAATAASPATGAQDAAEALPGECPPVLPVSEVRAGMTGTGLSVTRGRVPERFGAEVLGVLRDGAGPGRDIIIVETSGAAVTAARGIWFGMSGSPVYVRDPVTGQHKLIGAVAYGFTFGPSPIAGLTAAADMVRLLDPASTGTAAAREQIDLPPALAGKVARSLGASAPDSLTLERLKTPLAVAGVSERGMSRIREAVARQHLAFVPYAGSAGSSGSSGAPPSAGESFAAALTLGDITAAGIGTTTFVCYGQAVAFGHPFNWTGKTRLGAHAARTIGIVADPILGAFKLANVAESFGVVRSDRLAGIRANIGPPPVSTPVTSVVTNLDTGASRHGTTKIIFARAVPFFSFLHLFTNIDNTFDQIGPGSSQLEWTIRGRRASGAGFVLRRGNRYASPFDISFDSVNDLAFDLDLLTSNGLERINITSVDVSRAEVERAIRLYSLSGVLVSLDGVNYRQASTISARPGATIHLRALLRPYNSTTLVRVNLSLTLPRDLRSGGTIEIGAGSGEGGIPCLFDDGECGEESQVSSFDDLLAALRSQPRNDVLSARLRVGEPARTRASDSEALDRVVSGQRFIELELIR